MEDQSLLWTQRGDIVWKRVAVFSSPKTRRRFLWLCLDSDNDIIALRSFAPRFMGWMKKSMDINLQDIMKSIQVDGEGHPQ